MPLCGIDLEEEESSKLGNALVRSGKLKGFLGTQAGLAADITLLLQIVMGVALIAGVFLAHAKRFVMHGICQMTVLLLNLVVIALFMWPSFSLQVLPGLPKHFARLHYSAAALHGILGGVTELFGLYILLVAGTNVVPRAWRFRRWKLWMRVELALWMFVLLFGVGTYLIWYVVIP
jgi:uncharacterized membrane protein YozB (DUF420 family)